MSNELVTIETVNAVEVFQKGGADKKVVISKMETVQTIPKITPMK